MGKLIDQTLPDKHHPEPDDLAYPNPSRSLQQGSLADRAMPEGNLRYGGAYLGKRMVKEPVFESDGRDIYGRSLEPNKKTSDLNPACRMGDRQGTSPV